LALDRSHYQYPHLSGSLAEPENRFALFLANSRLPQHKGWKTSDIDGQIIKDQPTLHSADRSKDQFHEVSFLQGSTPNSDWGAAWGAGKTNNPSLYNVKYRANRTF